MHELYYFTTLLCLINIKLIYLHYVQLFKIYSQQYRLKTSVLLNGFRFCNNFVKLFKSI